jgi:polyphosphate kinase
VLEEIDRVVAAHSDEHPGRIDMKLNNLVDRAVIQALYRASQAGVKIRLLVRSVCCLRPGVPDLSETIEVRSLLGRFLEHSRALVFRDANGSRHYIGSADMMPRNLDHRVEVMTPVDDPELARELDEVLAICFADTRTSWLLHPDGAWERVAPAPDEPPRSAQDELMARAVAMAQEPVPEPEDLVAGERVVRLPRRPGADS